MYSEDSMQTAIPPKIWQFSQIGASHVRTNKPNQDSVGTLSLINGLVHILAVSDGHGSERYFRSDTGSKLAIKVARQVCEQFFDPIPISSDIKTRLDNLVRKIVYTWREEVRAHWEKFPFDESEESLLKNPDHIEAAYGATLLVSIITPNYAIFLQLGDGDIILIDSNKKIIQPIELEKGMLGTETHSLCEQDAEKFWRISVIGFQDSPRFILLSTDGYANSYPSNNSFFNMVGELYQEICDHGLGPILDSLPTWLAETTAQGSGDDISVALLSYDTFNKKDDNFKIDNLEITVSADYPHIKELNILKKINCISKIYNIRIQKLNLLSISMINKLIN